MYSSSIQNLVDSFSKLPGIGPKTAQRLTFHLLGKNERSKGLQLAEALQKAIANIRQCELCNTYTELDVCHICASPKRIVDTLCIVEQPADIVAIEQTHSYFGNYFVLHGYLSPLDGMGPAEINLPKLFTRIQTSKVIKELIIATNPSMEGKATAHYIASHLKGAEINCTRIAFGMPMGGEIEYLDSHTLAHALKTRLPFSKMADNTNY